MAKIKSIKTIPNFESRIITVTHPYVRDDNGEPLVLFKARVQIINIRTNFVKAITNVQIKYSLKESD